MRGHIHTNTSCSRPRHLIPHTQSGPRAITLHCSHVFGKPNDLLALWNPVAQSIPTGGQEKRASSDFIPNPHSLSNSVSFPPTPPCSFCRRPPQCEESTQRQRQLPLLQTIVFPSGCGDAFIICSSEEKRPQGIKTLILFPPNKIPDSSGNFQRLTSLRLGTFHGNPQKRRYKPWHTSEPLHVVRFP